MGAKIADIRERKNILEENSQVASLERNQKQTDHHKEHLDDS